VNGIVVGGPYGVSVPARKRGWVLPGARELWVSQCKDLAEFNANNQPHIRAHKRPRRHVLLEPRLMA
jgi:hypothetical protein